MNCELCGVESGDLDRCPACADSRPTARAAEARWTVNPVGVVNDLRFDTGGGHVVAKPASGGKVTSSSDADGKFTNDLVGPLDRGRASEGRVIRVFQMALRAVERTAGPSTKGDDAGGEDGVLFIDRQRVIVQCVSVPSDQAVWQELARSEAASKSGTRADAVALIRDALEKKRGRAVGTILLLDLTHWPAIIDERLVDAYFSAHTDPEMEFFLREVWIVGPTTQRTIRLQRRSA